MIDTSIKYEVEKIPASLIRDVIDGKPYYYKGYRNVLNKTKTIHDIMPSSTLQSVIISYFFVLLAKLLDLQKYRILASESGSHVAKNINYGLDLAIYDKSVLTSDKINDKYASVPPELVLEVDVKVELEGISEIEFINKKTESLLDFGVKKVIWVISKTKKILIAEQEKDWILADWNKEFLLINAIKANIGQYLKENDIQV